MSINKKTNNLIISKKEFFILTLLFLNPLSLDKFNINFIGLSHVILFILLIVKLNNLIYTIQKYKEFFLVSSLFIFFLILKLGFGFIFFSVNIYDYLIILNYFKVIIFIYLFFTILDKVNIIRILCYYTVLSSLWIIFSNIEFLNSNFSEKPGLVFVTNESTKNLIGFIFTQIFLISLLFFKEKKKYFYFNYNFIINSYLFRIKNGNFIFIIMFNYLFL